MIRQKRIYEMNRDAALYFHDCLINLDSADGEAVREYLSRRGLKRATVKHFGLGYAPGGWDGLIKHLLNKGYNREELRAGCLCSVTKTGNHVDFFRGRLMFPVIDVQGNVIAFGGRAIDDNGPKYLNSSDTPAFKKSRNLYALNFAKNSKRDYLVMCEGYMDVISMHQAGFNSAVATLGTAVTSDQARLIEKYAKRVVLAYDSDEAGKRAMNKAAVLLAEAGVDAQVLNMDEAKDPDEFIAKYGREKLADYLDKPKGYRETMIDAALAKYNLDIPGEAEKAINEACGEIAKMKEHISREVYAVHLSDIFKVPPANFFKKVEFLRKKHISDEKRMADKQFEERIKKEEVSAEGAIIGALLNYPEFYKDIKDILSEEYFTDDFERRVFAGFKNIIETSSFDMALFNQDFSADEVGEITRMTISEAASKFLNRADKLKNYINTFIKHKKTEHSEHSKDDWVNYIRSKGEKVYE
jgi:DNA primase